MPKSSASLPASTSDAAPAEVPAAMAPAVEAYVWGFPLISVQRSRALFCSRADTGVMNHIQDLATPADRGVVVPNNDTLYSSGWYDLRYGDLNIDVPAMDHPGRYWNLMIVDAYTHVAYVCRRYLGVDGTSVRVTFDPTTPAPNDASRVVPVATPTAWVIVRVLVETAADIATARRLQQAFVVTPPADHPKERTERAGRPTAIAATGPDIYAEIKRYSEADPPAPWHPQLSAEAQAIIDDPSAAAPGELEAGIEEGERLVGGGNLRGSVKQNGWSTGRDATGFGDDILKRAVGAKFGLGGHQAIENRSYTAQHDSEKAKLHGSRALVLRFEQDGLPPCNAFWSLTAYGSDLYLVENEIGRYSLGDRTPGLVYAPDGSLTVQVSADRPTDIANWLPVPAGPYLLGMRVYEGHPSVVACEWFPPPLLPQPTAE